VVATGLADNLTRMIFRQTFVIQTCLKHNQQFAKP